MQRKLLQYSYQILNTGIYMVMDALFDDILININLKSCLI